MKEYRVATVQILVDAEYEGADVLSEVLGQAVETGGIVDWAYLRIGGQWAYFTPTYLDKPYKEGDFLVAQGS